MLFSFLCSLLRCRAAGIALYWLSALLGWEFLAETAGTFAAYHYHSNYFVYSVSAPVGLLMATLYFHFSSKPVKHYRLCLFLFAAIALLQAANLLLLEPVHALNTIFQQMKCLSIVAYCLLHAYNYISYPAQAQLNFHIACLFLLYYGSSFFLRTAIGLLDSTQNALIHHLYGMLFITSLLFYLLTGLALLFSKNKPPDHG